MKCIALTWSFQFSDLSSKTPPNMQREIYKNVNYSIVSNHKNLSNNPDVHSSGMAEYSHGSQLGRYYQGTFSFGTTQGWAGKTIDIWQIGARKAIPFAKQFCSLSGNVNSLPTEKHYLRIHII